MDRDEILKTIYFHMTLYPDVTHQMISECGSCDFLEACDRCPIGLTNRSLRLQRKCVEMLYFIVYDESLGMNSDRDAAALRILLDAKEYALTKAIEESMQDG